MEKSVVLCLAIASLIVLSFISMQKKKKKKKEALEKILKILNEYDLTFSDILTYYCKYVGGHPERDRESSNLLFGAKNGKLIFFGTNFSISVGGEGDFLTYEKVKPYVSSQTELIHLFDIQIDSIVDIRYFDATTSSTMALVGGGHWAIPIRMKQGDASVLIDWNDGKYNHSTEFRFAGFFGGMQANKRANTLRNTFIRMTK